MPRRIPASDAQALLAHLSATSQSLFHELYVLDSNIHVPPEACYSLQYSTPNRAEAAFTLRPLGQVLDFCEKAHVLHHELQAAACSRWDLTQDESGRSVIACQTFVHLTYLHSVHHYRHPICSFVHSEIMRLTASHCISSSEPGVLSKLFVFQRKLLAPDGTQIYLAALRQAMSATAAHLDKFVDMCWSQPPEIDARAWNVKVNLHKMIEKVMNDFEEEEELRQQQQQQQQQREGHLQRSFLTYREGLSWFKVNGSYVTGIIATF
jgi:hypothetical protein